MILVAVPFLAHMGDPNGANQPGLAYWSVFAILFIFGWISGVA
jgi:solute carrier family 29 (equilibrative nucleoside transporter), member 1/2/3